MVVLIIMMQMTMTVIMMVIMVEMMMMGMVTCAISAKYDRKLFAGVWVVSVHL